MSNDSVRAVCSCLVSPPSYVDDEQYEVVVVSTTKKLTKEAPEALVAVEVTPNIGEIADTNDIEHDSLTNVDALKSDSEMEGQVSSESEAHASEQDEEIDVAEVRASVDSDDSVV